ncbi:MAG: hypothetical protein JWR38_1504 [Mucilaginibacter sp.]|nr:hypothetical protein [Mucilaginibacter sp.]
MTTQVKLFREFLWMLLISILLLCCGKASAQVLPDYSAFPQSSVGLQAGTQGLGIQGSKSIAKTFNIRAGFNMVPDITVQYKSRDLRVDRTDIYAIADWQPLYGNNSWLARKWFISAGAVYYFSNTVYRQSSPDYSVALSKFRPYIGTGLGNIRVSNNIGMRIDLGYFIPTQSPVSTDESKSGTLTSGFKGLLPGLNTGVTFYFKF